MNIEQVKNELRSVIARYKNRTEFTGEVCRDIMARDCLNAIEELQAENERLNREQKQMEVQDNEHFFHKRLTKRLTYRQLSRWLATGKGEFLNTETHYASSRSFYQESKSDEEVSTNILVRTWDSEEWVQPTTKIIGELK